MRLLHKNVMHIAKSFNGHIFKETEMKSAYIGHRKKSDWFIFVKASKVYTLL